MLSYQFPLFRSTESVFVLFYFVLYLPDCSICEYKISFSYNASTNVNCLSKYENFLIESIRNVYTFDQAITTQLI